MAIVHYLTTLDSHVLPSPRSIYLDDLQAKVRENLFLELPQADGSHCLFSPALSPISEDVEKRIRNLLQENSAILEYLKDRLINALVLDTAILETASYFIQQNDFLVLARLKYFKEIEKLLEIKLYTVSKRDITVHYSDKIYIGRLFLNMEQTELHYNGLNLYVLSLMDQYANLKNKSKTHLNNPKRYRNYFVEINELISDVVGEVIRSLDAVPPVFEPVKWSADELVRIKACYRSIVHLILELSDEVSEFENVLRFNREDRFARYVTKYRKDLKNIIHQLNFNVLAKLAHRIQTQSSVTSTPTC
ncbi:MAG: hypothetical protein JXQ27_01025 [Acidobacteria bacterium]|nr:hypothetical protein [Acidobacteriota bacterium]